MVVANYKPKSMKSLQVAIAKLKSTLGQDIHTILFQDESIK